jgi:hypothetical protein
VRNCEKGLRALLGEARALDPPVWIATLGQIAQWWRDRRAFSFEVNRLDDRRWSVRANCSERATILVKSCATDAPTTQWPGAYECVGSRDFTVESPVFPSVGVAPGSSQEAIRFLKTEGYPVEVSDAPAEHSLFLDGLADFGESDEKRLSEAIEQSDAGLVRFWRWPDGAQSALAVTGDIDSMTLIDFLLRVLEVWRNRIAR